MSSWLRAIRLTFLCYYGVEVSGQLRELIPELSAPVWEWPNIEEDGFVPTRHTILDGVIGKDCPIGCGQYGTCNPELGRCDCLPHRTGPDCSQLLAPACRVVMVHKNGHTYATEFDMWSEMHEGRFDKEMALWFQTNQTWNSAAFGALPLPQNDVMHGGKSYYTPCDARTPKTCECARQCEDAGITFFNETFCVNAAMEVVSALDPCAGLRHCSYHGSCSVQKDGSATCRCFQGWEGGRCQLASESFCLGGCNGRGACKGGICHCQDPFYGADCGLYLEPSKLHPGEQIPKRVRYKDAAVVTHPGVAHIRRSAKIYVYDLPTWLNTALYYHQAATLQGASIHPALASLTSPFRGAGPPRLTSPRRSGCQDLLAHGLGADVGCLDARIANEDPTVGILELALHDRLLASAHRTLNPLEADYFYVPTWQSAADGFKGNYLERVVEYLQNTWPFWDKKQGTDHIFFLDVRTFSAPFLAYLPHPTPLYMYLTHTRSPRPLRRS
ncbi:hypothetical protein CYMTET_13951 [Cymbomonas tetramitiformis]|uniref:EGF-like domain-containing protein n=1 Tax=Cymbomonas tetramitiformis TaxID=36881 RepID=A0AAE0LAI1_9CHLO|nr:hypothetical protein CYMTET_13951 [Cymbomonas tetramitiformis]